MRATYTQQLLDRATAYVEQPLTTRRGTEQGLAELTTLYSLITGEAVGSCRQCQVSDFLAAVNQYIREATRFLHPELMEDSKYTFAPAYANEQIADSRYNKTVKAENLTDADAEQLIKLGYGHVIVAKYAPEAAGEDQKPAGDTKPADTKAADALKAEKKAHGETKKELAELQKQLAESQKQVADLTAAAAATPEPVAPEPEAPVA